MQWILDDATNIDSITSVEGLSLDVATGQRRAGHLMELSVPRTAFKVQVHTIGGGSSALPSQELECLNTPGENPLSVMGDT